MSKSLIAKAKEQHSDITFIQADFLDLPFEDNFFHGLWAHASLLHFEQPSQVEKALSEFNRVLTKNGLIHVFVKQQLGEEKTSVVVDTLSNHPRFFQFQKIGLDIII